MSLITANGGELTVLSPVASHTWGTWHVEWPEWVPENKKNLPPEGKELGYIAKLPDAPSGLMGRRFVRADVAITAEDYTQDGVKIAHSGISNAEAMLDDAAGKTKGGVFLERDLTTAHLSGHTPGVDFQVSDVIPVEIWGKRTTLPVTRIEAISDLGETIGWSVHLGGELIDDSAREKGLFDLERAIALENRERKKAVGETRVMASSAASVASSARSDAAVARREAAGAVDAAARAVVDTAVEYAAGVSREVAPVSGWSQAYPGDGTGPVWQRTVSWFGDGRVERSEPGLMTGPPGADGADGAVGPRGPQGQQGPRGPQGPKGDSGKDGVPGKAGVGVRDSTVTYAASSSGTAAPSSGWSSQPPANVPAGHFVWTKLTLRYTDNTVEDVFTVGKSGERGPQGAPGARGATGAQGPKGDSGSDGRPGKDGTKLLRTDLAYAASSSGTTAPTSGWSSQPPAAKPGQFVWTRFVWHYSDKSSETGYSVGKIGQTGERGPQGAKGDKGATGAQGPRGAKGDKGEDGGKIYDTRKTNETPQWYIDNHPNSTVKELKRRNVIGLDDSGGYVTMETTVPWRDFTGGPVLQSVKLGTTRFLRQSVGPGLWSDWVEKGVSVESVTHFWRWAGSRPATPTGTGNPTGWSTSQPAYQVGQKLWVTIRTVFSNNNVTWSTPTEEASVSAATAIAAESANTKNRVWYAATAPGSTRGERDGDTWFRYSGNTIVGQWRWTGSSWAQQTIDGQVIANLDAGKITTGTLDARRIGAGSITADKIKADSITVNELRAGTIVPLGASLIHAEPRVSGGVPEPIWWQVCDKELAADYLNWPRPNGHPWRMHSQASFRKARAYTPKRLMKVQPGKKYRVRFWARSAGGTSDSRLWVSLKDQDGKYAIASGSVSGHPGRGEGQVVADTGQWDGWTGRRLDYSRALGKSWLIYNWAVPSQATLVETVITFLPGVEYVYLDSWYFNDVNSSATADQWIAGLSIDLDVPDQEQIDALQTKQIKDNEARVGQIAKLSTELDARALSKVTIKGGEYAKSFKSKLAVRAPYNDREFWLFAFPSWRGSVSVQLFYSNGRVYQRNFKASEMKLWDKENYKWNYFKDFHEGGKVLGQDWRVPLGDIASITLLADQGEWDVFESY